MAAFKDRFRNPLPRIVQLVGLAIIIIGVAYPVQEYASSGYTADLLNTTKHYFFGSILSKTVPLGMLGLLVFACDAVALSWRDKANRLERESDDEGT